MKEGERNQVRLRKTRGASLSKLGDSHRQKSCNGFCRLVILAQQEVVKDEKCAPKRDGASVALAKALVVARRVRHENQLCNFFHGGVAECLLTTWQVSMVVRALRWWFMFEGVEPG